MAKLSKNDKEEMLRLAKSIELKEDYRRINKNREQLTNVKDGSQIDIYIEFLTLSNSFISHSKKPFKKMTGDHFIL